MSVACSAFLPQQAIPSGQAAAARAPAKHLYVIEFDSVRAVLEYAIRGGIPQAKPDRVVSGLVGPNAIALDGAGHLFVLDGRIVKEFAAGASGHAHPIRQIHVPISLNIGSLAVDRAGYLYVGQAGHLYVFAPGAHGRAAPVEILKPRGYPSSLAIDAADDLYALGNTQKEDPILAFTMHVTVYASAPKLKRTRRLCSHQFPDHGINYGIVFDGLGHLFTTHPYFIESSPAGEIDMYPENANACPIDPLSMITTSNPSLLGPVYLAVNPPYLYVYDLDYGNGGVVFTLRTTGSAQTPLSTLYVANNRGHDVQGIAVGP
jgi:hypothetical protein